MSNENRKILLVGATRMAILDACLEKGLSVRALIRSGKADVEKELEERGVEIAHGVS